MSLQNLNPQQLEAVQTTEGPLLVLAGAGTGKTRVLTTRIINILSSNLASPNQILAVTFTNKGAAEMKKRIAEAIGDQINNLWIGTFHSIASKILRRHADLCGLKTDFTIIDEDDQTRLLRQILTELNIDTKQFPIKSYLYKISRLKDIGKSSYIGEDINLPKLKDVYETYQYRLKTMNAVDFGDLLLSNLQIFKEHPSVLSYYQERFRYVLVDEYQDTNSSQYQWLLFLSAKNQNICCVGDDDQSIYSWRGADINNILRFEKDFSNAKIIRLEQNYRSTSKILQVAKSVISNNQKRHGKNLWTNVEGGEEIKITSFDHDRQEALETILEIKKHISNHKIKPNQIAILVRAGYQTRAFEEAFIGQSISYRIIGGMKFYERMEIKDCLSYLRICSNPKDDLALSRIINVPKRGIGEATLKNLYEIAKQNNISIFSSIKNFLSQGDTKSKAKQELEKLILLIESFNQEIHNRNLHEIAKIIFEEFGYIEMWKNEDSFESRSRLENIEELIRSLEDFENISDFLEYVSLIENKDEKNLEESVSVMTVHAAKGLEFDLVFVPGLEEGVFPSSKSLDEKDGIEEERRLMYVAITRAKKFLILSYANSRYVFGDMQMQSPSRFLAEINPNFKNLNKTKYQSFLSQNIEEKNNSSFQKDDIIIGRRVFHQKFGYGKILEISDNKFKILFEKTGVKIVIKDFISFA